MQSCRGQLRRRPRPAKPFGTELGYAYCSRRTLLQSRAGAKENPQKTRAAFQAGASREAATSATRAVWRPSLTANGMAWSVAPVIVKGCPEVAVGGTSRERAVGPASPAEESTGRAWALASG